ncbi:MAG: YbbR-like domain-containing protein [Roseburia sp.]
MLKKIIKKLTNNFGLKILAILFAAVMWVVVVNIDDPVKSDYYTTSISFENQDFITAQNKVFEVLDGSNTITFRVSANRTILNNLSNADFSATADMSKIEYDAERESFRVPVTITQSKYRASEVSIATKLYKEVALENLGRIQKPIIAETGGVVAEGCALGKVELTGSNIMKIQGPASIVSQIDKVVASVNVDGMATDVTDVVIPVFYDANGDVIDTTKLKLSVDKVSIKAQILNTKDVPLEFLTSGSPAEGYVMTEVSCKPEKVRIKGEAVVLNPVNKITIPEEVLDLTGATQTIETTVDISSYMPEGTMLVLTSDAKVSVTVKIEPLKTKTFEISTENLSVRNLREGYELTFEENTVFLELEGRSSVIDALKAEDISGMIDAEGLGRGEHQLEIILNMEDTDLELVNRTEVSVSIVRKETADSQKNIVETDAA